MTASMFEQRSAAFSPCRTWRYSLRRTWDGRDRPLVVCALNPSTADETTNDPTVERLERRARMRGHGGLVVVNLFAFRATDPRVMRAAADPVGPDNDCAILEAAKEAGLFLCAWGQHGAHLGRAEQVEQALRAAGIPLYALRLAKDGAPTHPLYLPYDLEPFLWERGAP